MIKNIRVKNRIILTGAGFTKNFGGFLANEMWSHIFNNPHIQNSSILRSELQNNFDFESVYSNIIDNPRIQDSEKEKIKEAVLGAYTKLDNAIKGWKFNSDGPYPVNRYGLAKLLGLFNGGGDEQGFFFTLNQDLFMERIFGYSCPGVPKFSSELYRGAEVLKQNDFISLPYENVENAIISGIRSHAGLAYIKLHGSYGWKSANGSTQLVIGKNKVGSIGTEPVLKYYFDLFEAAIKQGSKKLLIIGYGFQDQHINEVLLDGVKNHSLKIYIIGQNPQSVKERIEGGHYYAKDILEGVAGYFPYTLKEIFPGNQQKTVHLEDIEEALLKTIVFF